MDKKCGTNCVDPPILHIQRGDKVKIVHNDCDGCHHMTVKIHDPTIRSEEFLLDENYRWWDQTTWTYYDKVHPWITGKFVVGLENPEKLNDVKEPDTLVCPQGFEPVNGECPDKPVVESTTEPKLGIASFVDKSKNPQSYIDRYNSEPSYKKWFNDNYSQYDSIEQAVGLELTAKIPDWIKNVFLWYGQDQVSEDELLNAIKYLIDEGILIVN